MYQNLAQQLMPWVVKAEKYCATELPKCSSMEEAKDLYDLHQVGLGVWAGGGGRGKARGRVNC